MTSKNGLQQAHGGPGRFTHLLLSGTLFTSICSEFSPLVHACLLRARVHFCQSFRGAAVRQCACSDSHFCDCFLIPMGSRRLQLLRIALCLRGSKSSGSSSRASLVIPERSHSMSSVFCALTAAARMFSVHRAHHGDSARMLPKHNRRDSLRVCKVTSA